MATPNYRQNYSVGNSVGIKRISGSSLTEHEKALNPRSQRSKSAMNITPTKTNWHNPKERIRQEKNQQHSQSKAKLIEKRKMQAPHATTSATCSWAKLKLASITNQW
jgi:hypothetical protein